MADVSWHSPAAARRAAPQHQTSRKAVDVIWEGSKYFSYSGNCLLYLRKMPFRL